MANAKTVYVVNNDLGIEEFTTLGQVSKYLGKSKITKADVEAGKYPEVTMRDAVEESVDLEHKDAFAKQEAEQEQQAMLDDPSTEVQEPFIEEPARENAQNAAKASALEAISKAMEATSDTESPELFDSLCDLEDAINDGLELTDAQAKLMTQVLTNTLGEEDNTHASTNTEDEGMEVPEDSEDLLPPANDTEYPEVGDFKEVKAMKKFIKGLSDASLQEWCILEGAKWNPSDHESINRMRMAMAIKALHFPETAPKKGKKSKSKYGHISLEELVQMVLENDVEVPDAKGDPKIERMYMIMALKKAGHLE